MAIKKELRHWVSHSVWRFIGEAYQTLDAAPSQLSDTDKDNNAQPRQSQSDAENKTTENTWKHPTCMSRHNSCMTGTVSLGGISLNSLATPSVYITTLSVQSSDKNLIFIHSKIWFSELPSNTYFLLLRTALEMAIALRPTAAPTPAATFTDVLSFSGA